MFTVLSGTPFADIAEIPPCQSAEFILWLNMTGIHAKVDHMMLQ